MSKKKKKTQKKTKYAGKAVFRTWRQAKSKKWICNVMLRDEPDDVIFMSKPCKSPMDAGIEVSNWVTENGCKLPGSG